MITLSKFLSMDLIQLLSFPSLRFAIKKGAKLIGISYRGLPLRIFLADIGSILFSVGFVIVPAALLAIILLFFGQGKDTMLLIIERMTNGDWWSLLCLLFALMIWSIFSELSVRYSIAISDNSGMNLRQPRIDWRITVQKLTAALSLLLPGLIVLGSVVWTLSVAEYLDNQGRWRFGGIAIFLILLQQAVLGELYFRKFGKGVSLNPKKTILGKRSLPYLEQRWLGKLFGIYNDYIFTHPKPSNFRPPYNKPLQDFANLLDTDGISMDDLPQDEKVVNRSRLVPNMFRLGNPRKIAGRQPIFQWVYRIPTSFYKQFHWHVIRMAWVSLSLLVVVAVIPSDTKFYAYFGAPGLLCLAFGCYTGIYSGLLYLDKVTFRKSPLSIRLLLLIWVIVISCINDDHPIRLLGHRQQRMEVNEQFHRWFEAYKTRFGRAPGKIPHRYPVIFVCAEGGAFRTGAYTAMLLTQLEADLAKRKEPIDFRSGIFAMSGVSGGAVGLGFYNAVAFRSRKPVVDYALVEKAQAFFLHDSLSPIIGRMFYGEFLNLFYWRSIPLFDRAIVLEKAWEAAYEEFGPEKDVNTYDHPFLLNPDTGAVKPIFIINTMEVETGLQCVLTNTLPKGMLFENTRDLFGGSLENVRYSTAINFSSRFPLFSPGGMLSLPKGIRRHYLDGGYVENTGAASMLELINLIKGTTDYKNIVPVVLSLRFSADSTAGDGIRNFNELNEIVSGMLNIRAGRSNTAIAELKREIESCDGVWIEAPLTPEEKEIPMNWVLSTQSMRRIRADINKKLSVDSNLLIKLLRRDITYMPLKK
ncbi:MAG: hypothetical protein EOP48_00570 [Sphingobacteriales bacterium]|nr:MAG: hypothetical protein EOP48_00570 [Sphingobacteriales bacterium]